MSDQALIRCPINWSVYEQFLDIFIGVWSDQCLLRPWEDSGQGDYAFLRGWMKDLLLISDSVYWFLPKKIYIKK